MDARFENILAKLLTKQAIPDEYSTTELVEVYNIAVARLDRAGDKIKSFHDKGKAVKRVTHVLVELVSQAAIDKRETKAAVLAVLTPSPSKTNGVTAADAFAGRILPPAKTKAPAKGASRSKVDGTKTIHLVKDANPHRAGSKDFEKYAKISEGMTVETAVAKGVEIGYLTYAAKRKLVELR